MLQFSEQIVWQPTKRSNPVAWPTSPSLYIRMKFLTHYLFLAFGAYFFNPLLATDCQKAFESTKAHYDNVAKEYAQRHSHSSPQVDKLREEFLSMLPSGGSILDVGSGPGRDAIYFDRLGYEVVATDISPQMISHVMASIGPRSSAIVLRAQELYFENDFNGVWAMASLIHIPEEEMLNALKRIARALKPGGIFMANMLQGVGTPDVGEIEAKGRFFNRMSQTKFLKIASLVPELVFLPAVSSENLDDYHGERKPTAEMGFYNLFFMKQPGRNARR